MAIHWFGLLLTVKQAHQSGTLTETAQSIHDRFLDHIGNSTYSTTFTSGSGTTHNDNKSDVLQNSDGGSDSDNMESDRFEFIAFLLWYLFLVFCCVVPTCCAYRRRRQAELRLTAQQQANLNQRLQHSNLYILSNMQRHANNSERIQLERKRILGEELNATTMTLAQTDIEDGDGSSTELADGHAKTATMDAATTTDTLQESADVTLPIPTTTDEEFAFTEDNGIVRLPADRQNANRTVPGCCAICLCPYVDGDQISWSSGSSSCLHAFHTDCVLSWLAKKEEPQCPVCRQPFCARAHVSDTNLLDPSSPATYSAEPPSFLDSFSQAFALSQFYRRQEAAFAAARSPEDMEAIRQADQMEWRNLALRHHMLRASMMRDAEERAVAQQQQQRGGDGTNVNHRALQMLMYDIPFTFRYMDRNNSISNSGESGSGSGNGAEDTAQDRRPSVSVESGAAADEVHDASSDTNNGSLGDGGGENQSIESDVGARGSSAVDDLERGSTDEQ